VALVHQWFCLLPDAPVLSLQLGSSLNPNSIKEGDDVYFECHIKANPSIHKLSWYHNVSLFMLRSGRIPFELDVPNKCLEFYSALCDHFLPSWCHQLSFYSFNAIHT